MIEELAPPMAPPLPATPYVGLIPYGEEDAGFFFGRGKEQRVIAGNLRASRLTIVYGPSGVGKTSLLQAGVIHGLRERVIANTAANGERAPFAICAFAAWRDDPLPILVEAIRASAVEASGGVELPAWRAGEPLVDALRAWTERVRPLLVVLDQFEDYFLYHADEDGDGTFAAEFPRIVNEPNLRVNFVVSIREDAWAKLDRFKGDIPRLFSNYVRVEHLRPEAAGQAIEGPVAEWNRRSPAEAQPYTVERELVGAVIEATAAGRLALAEGGQGATPETAETDGIEAPFLQLVMERLWRATVEAGSRELTLARLAELGGPERIVETHLHEALGGLTGDEQRVTADMFRYLVTRSKTKISHSASDLAEWTKRPAPEVSAVLEKLCRGESGRILRPVEAPNETEAMRYELFHDMLAEPILDWRRGHEQRRTRRRWAAVGAGLLALVAVFAALGAWALVQRGNARDQADRARSEARTATSLALASRAQANVATRPDVALLLSLAALTPYRAGPDSPTMARSTMIDALQAARLQGLAGMLHGGSAVVSVAFSPDGRTLATGNYDNTVRLWDLATNRQLASLPTAKPVLSVAFSPGGRTLAAGGLDGRVWLWEAATHRPLGSPLTTGAPSVNSVAFSPDGRTLATAGDDGKARLWELAGRRQLGSPLSTGAQGVNSVAFSPDGRTLATAGDDGRVWLWDRATQRRHDSPLSANRKRVFSVAFSPDGRTLATAGDDGKVRLWDRVSERQQGAPLSATAKHLYSVAFRPDGRTIAAGGKDGRVQLWDRATHRRLRSPPSGNLNPVQGLAFSPDGGTLAAGSYDGTVRLWDPDALTQPGSPLRASAELVYSVAFSPDGRTLASAGEDSSVQLWDPTTRGQRGSPLTTGADSLYTVAFSRDGRTLAAASDDGRVWLWDTASRAQRGAPLSANGKSINSVAFSPGGRTLATAGEEKMVRLWDLASRRQVGAPLTTKARSIFSIAFSRDGRTLAAAGDDGRVWLWDPEARKPAGSLATTKGIPVVSVAFSPDGRTLAAGSYDGKVRLWDLSTRRALGVLPTASSKMVLSVAFSPDGRTLAAARYDGRVQLWDTATREPLGSQLRANSKTVESIAFSPDGQTLAAGGDDGTVRLWSGFSWRDLAALKEQVCRVVGDDLSRSEWKQYAPAIAYRDSCP